jgi:hypothetical protein
MKKKCPHCSAEFLPSRYHPDQTTCSAPQCQVRRRNKYHRDKLADDPLYREQCRDSQRNWREKNKNYQKRYRSRLKTFTIRDGNSELQQELHRLEHLAKNNVALNLKRLKASIWLLCPAGAKQVKNTFAKSQVIVLEVSMLSISPH